MSTDEFKKLFEAKKEYIDDSSQWDEFTQCIQIIKTKERIMKKESCDIVTIRPDDLIFKNALQNIKYVNPFSRRELRAFKADFIIDLHGYPKDKSLKTITECLYFCQQNFLLKVMLITGKGEGVLRNFVWHVICFGEMSHMIAKASFAPKHLGGYGAIVVKLNG